MGVQKRRLPEEALERVVARFDHRSPELATDPFGVYAKLRERCPLHRSEAWDGFWVVASQPLVDEVAHDDARFCTGQGVSFPHAGQPPTPHPAGGRPARRRRLAPPPRPLFSPAATERRTAEVRAIARDLVDGFAARGRCDVVSDFAEALPARETMRLVGLPEERWRECLDNIHIGVHESARDLDKAGRRHDRGGGPAGRGDGGPGGGTGRRRHQLPALGRVRRAAGERGGDPRHLSPACSSGGSTRPPR